MTPERRNELMDRLEAIKAEIQEISDDIESRDKYEPGEDCEIMDLETNIAKLEDERDSILEEFPEVKYWPKEFGTLIGSTVAHKVKEFNPRKNCGKTQCGRAFRASDRYESDLPWHERALEANGVYLPMCCHCRDR